MCAVIWFCGASPGTMNVSRHAHVLSLIQARADGGKALASDVDQARERLLAAGSVSEDVKWALDEAYAKFHEVVGLRAKGIRAVKRPRGLPRTRRTAVSIAVNNSPAVRAANTSIDAAKFERERAGGAYAPQIFAECCATYGRKIGGTPGQGTDVKSGVVFSWNLFSRLQRRNRLNEMDARINAARHQRDAQVRTARAAVERAWAGLVRGRKRLSVIRQQVASNKGIVRSYQEV